MSEESLTDTSQVEKNLDVILEGLEDSILERGLNLTPDQIHEALWYYWNCTEEGLDQPERPLGAKECGPYIVVPKGKYKRFWAGIPYATVDYILEDMKENP